MQTVMERCTVLFGQGVRICSSHSARTSSPHRTRLEFLSTWSPKIPNVISYDHQAITTSRTAYATSASWNARRARHINLRGRPSARVGSRAAASAKPDRRQRVCRLARSGHQIGDRSPLAVSQVGRVGLAAAAWHRASSCRAMPDESDFSPRRNPLLKRALRYIRITWR